VLAKRTGDIRTASFQNDVTAVGILRADREPATRFSLQFSPSGHLSENCCTPLLSRQVNIDAAAAGASAFRLAASEATTKQPDRTDRVKQFDIREAFKAGTQTSRRNLHTIAMEKSGRRSHIRNVSQWGGPRKVPGHAGWNSVLSASASSRLAKAGNTRLATRQFLVIPRNSPSAELMRSSHDPKQEDVLMHNMSKCVLVIATLTDCLPIAYCLLTG